MKLYTAMFLSTFNNLEKFASTNNVPQTKSQIDSLLYSGLIHNHVSFTMLPFKNIHRLGFGYTDNENNLKTNKDT